MKTIHKDGLHGVPNATHPELRDNTKAQAPVSFIQDKQREKKLTSADTGKEMEIYS